MEKISEEFNPAEVEGYLNPANDSRCKFRDEFCNQFIEFASNGGSIWAFCGKVLVGSKTMIHWLKKYPQFAMAKEIGESLSLLWYENQMNNQIDGTSGGSSKALELALKNKFPKFYRDKIFVEDETKEDLSDEDIEAQILELEEKLKNEQ